MPEPITIGICAPASDFDKAKFDESLRFLGSHGFKTSFSDTIFSGRCGLTDSDELIAQDINALFSDDTVDVIMCVRGGYGSSRIIDKLDTDLIRSSGKIFIGASDVCALMFYLENSSAAKVFFGPFVTEMNSDMDIGSLEMFLKIIRDGETSHTVAGLTALSEGKVTAEVTGGCLSIIVSSLKTPYEIVTDGKILFIEDVNEPLYRIDRMLTQLKNAGKLEKIKGAIAGAFTNLNVCTDSFHALLLDIFSDYNIPIVTGFPAGHGRKKSLIPFKTMITLNADEKRVSYP